MNKFDRMCKEEIMAEIRDDTLAFAPTKLQKMTDNFRRSLTRDMNSRPPENETRVQFTQSRRLVAREWLKT
jgi:hypothetical protein